MFKTFRVRHTYDDHGKWHDRTFNVNHISTISYHISTISSDKNKTFIEVGEVFYEVHGSPTPKLMCEMLENNSK